MGIVCIEKRLSCIGFYIEYVKMCVSNVKLPVKRVFWNAIYAIHIAIRQHIFDVVIFFLNILVPKTLLLWQFLKTFQGYLGINCECFLVVGCYTSRPERPQGDK